MYDKSDKRRLYWLIDQYLSDNLDETGFCDEFYYSYDLEVDRNTLTDIEKIAFASLSKVSDRFSLDEEDQKLYPGTYSTVKELKEKITETKERLQQQSG